MTHCLILPYPPSANRYWKHANNRTYVSAEAKAYKSECGWSARSQSAAEMPLAGPVRLTMRFYRPRKAGDLDNRLKVTLDALNGIVFVDDAQVVELHAYRYEDKRNPRVEVEIQEVS